MVTAACLISEETVLQKTRFAGNAVKEDILPVAAVREQTISTIADEMQATQGQIQNNVATSSQQPTQEASASNAILQEPDWTEVLSSDSASNSNAVELDDHYWLPLDCRSQSNAVDGPRRLKHIKMKFGRTSVLMLADSGSVASFVPEDLAQMLVRKNPKLVTWDRTQIATGLRSFTKDVVQEVFSTREWSLLDG